MSAVSTNARLFHSGSNYVGRQGSFSSTRRPGLEPAKGTGGGRGWACCCCCCGDSGAAILPGLMLLVAISTDQRRRRRCRARACQDDRDASSLWTSSERTSCWCCVSSAALRAPRNESILVNVDARMMVQRMRRALESFIADCGMLLLISVRQTGDTTFGIQFCSFARQSVRGQSFAYFGS
jgi:hypothetical protein